MHPVGADLADRRGAEGPRHLQEGRRAGEEHVRPRPAVLAVQPADRGHGQVPRDASSPATSPIMRRQHRRVPGRLELRRDHRGLRGLLRGQAGQLPAGDYRNISGNLALAYGLVAAVAARPGCRCSSAPTRSPRPPTSCTSCASTSGSACAPSRPRTRSPRSAPRSARRSAVRSAVTSTSGPGLALKAETIGLAVSLELPLIIVRRPARRPVDRHADQDRAGRPAAGDVRAQRRGAGADRRAALARRTASTPRSRRRGSRRRTACR